MGYVVVIDRNDIRLLRLRRLLVLWFAAAWAGDAVRLGNLPNGDLRDAKIVGDGGIGLAGRGEDFIPHGLVEEGSGIIHELL
jgi:hypothetical protein